MTALEETLPPVSADGDARAVATNLDELVEMNSDDFSTVAANGGDAGAVLEFRFSAANEEIATLLAEQLVGFDYAAAPESPEGDYDEWSVRGTTVEATVTEAGLTEWQRRMIELGLQHGDCVLDGWALVLD